MCYYRERNDDGTPNRAKMHRMCKHGELADLCLDGYDGAGNLSEDPRRKVVICDEPPPPDSPISGFSANTSEAGELAEREKEE
ncbi:hypothetical protein MMC15_000921, partial [Xylographa vitiligo]|nr:hypothetical protein [Xylographa vitiligo]